MRCCFSLLVVLVLSENKLLAEGGAELEVSAIQLWCRLQ